MVTSEYKLQFPDLTAEEEVIAMMEFNDRDFPLSISADKKNIRIPLQVGLMHCEQTMEEPSQKRS